MNGRGTYLQRRHNVALETVAHHDQLFGLYLQLTAKSSISLGCLVAHDAHHVKVTLQSRTPQFVLLVLQLTLGEYRKLVWTRLSEPCQRLLHALQRTGIEPQQGLAQLHDSPYQLGRHLALTHLHGILHQRDGKGFHTISQVFHITALCLEERSRYLLLASIV